MSKSNYSNSPSDNPGVFPDSLQMTAHVIGSLEISKIAIQLNPTLSETDREDLLKSIDDYIEEHKTVLLMFAVTASVLFFMFMAYQVGQQKVYKHLADTAIEQQNLDAFALIMDEWTKFVR